jgi:hypothetical protein
LQKFYNNSYNSLEYIDGLFQTPPQRSRITSERTGTLITASWPKGSSHITPRVLRCIGLGSLCLPHCPDAHSSFSS